MCQHINFDYKLLIILGFLCAQPFVEEGHVIHSYFLPRWYAVATPIALEGVCWQP